MEITNCLNCPFRTSIANDWSMGFDNADICSLQQNAELINVESQTNTIVIRQYNDCEDSPSEIESPSWCPLKIIENIDINFKF